MTLEKEVAQEILDETECVTHYSDGTWKCDWHAVPLTLQRKMVGAVMNFDDVVACNTMRQLCNMLRDSLLCGEPSDADAIWVFHRLRYELEKTLATRAEEAVAWHVLAHSILTSFAPHD